MSDAILAEMSSIIEQHQNFTTNKASTRIRCNGCQAVMPIGDPASPQTAFLKHVVKDFADLANELASWRKKAAALGPDLTGLTGLDLVVANAREGDLVRGVFHNDYLGKVTIEGVLVPSINAGQLVVGGQVINEGHRPAGAVRELEILEAAGA